jgi:ADP-heptose:LPS heptosyltransferase
VRNPFEPGLLGTLGTVRSIVVVRPSRLGDLVCAGPAIELLARLVPHAEVTLVALPLAHDLAVRLPGVHRVVPFPGWPGIAEQLFEPRDALEAVRRLQAHRFDLAVQLYGSGVHANPFTLLLGARAAAGFVRPGDPAGRLDAALPLAESGHEVDRMLALPRFLADGSGTPLAAPPPRLLLRPDDARAAAHLLGGVTGPVLGVHAGARDGGRRWVLPSAAAGLAAVHRAIGGTVVSLGDEDAPDVAGALAGSGLPTLDLRARMGIGPLAAVLQRLDVLVTTDSGPAHLAYATATPSVTLVGPSDPGRHGPPAGPHIVLRAPHDADGVRPAPDAVVAAVLAVIGGRTT